MRTIIKNIAIPNNTWMGKINQYDNGKNLKKYVGTAINNAIP